jgi:hypothetical protein
MILYYDLSAIDLITVSITDSESEVIGIDSIRDDDSSYPIERGRPETRSIDTREWNESTNSLSHRPGDSQIEYR